MDEYYIPVAKHTPSWEKALEYIFFLPIHPWICYFQALIIYIDIGTYIYSSTVCSFKMWFGKKKKVAEIKKKM